MFIDPSRWSQISNAQFFLVNIIYIIDSVFWEKVKNEIQSSVILTINYTVCYFNLASQFESFEDSEGNEYSQISFAHSLLNNNTNFQPTFSIIILCSYDKTSLLD